MRTMHSVVKRGALYWDRELTPARAFSDRIAAIQTRIASHGDDAWLLVGDVVRHGPVVYATNFMPRVRSALAFIPVEGEPTLFANISLRDIPAAQTITDVKDIRAFSRLPKELSTFLEERLPTGGVVGTCGVEGCLPATDWWAIEEAVPRISWRPRDADIAAMRARKDAFEVAAIRKSMALADLALDAAPALLRQGNSMRVVVAELDRLVRSRGAEDVRFLVATGSQALRPVDDRIPKPGDCVLIYCAVQNQRYWGEAAQAYAMGAISSASRALHDKALRAIEAMTAGIAPSVSAAMIANTAADMLGDDDASAFQYGLGGGIGLDASEIFAISPADDTVINDGATLALRVILHGADASVAVTRTLHLGDQGVRLLGRRDSLTAV